MDYSTMGAGGAQQFKRTLVGQRSGIEPLPSLRTCAHVVRSNHRISPFTSVLYWPQHQFSINGFEW